MTLRTSLAAPFASLALAAVLLAAPGTTPLPGLPSSGFPESAPPALAALGSPTPAHAAELPRWQWPLRPRPRVETPYSPPPKNWMPGHRGVDLAASTGQDVLAPANGTISFSGTVVDRGVVTVSTTDGYRISFEPVSEALPRGTPVRAGQRIAQRAAKPDHEDCGSCLHWGVRDATGYLNPLLFVGAAHPSVLWPVPEGRAPR